MLHKVVVEFDASSIKHYDGEHCIVHGDQADEDWWNVNKCNPHWGDITRCIAPDIFNNIIPISLCNVCYLRDQ